MIFPALKRKTNMGRVAEVASVPAPVKGWNARDGWASMHPLFAVRLDDYFPTAEGVQLRGGTERHVTLTGVNDAPETLMIHSSGSTSKMLACAEGAIYNVSSSGTVNSSLASGFTNNRWSYENMNGYIVFVNGADTPRKYDGSTVSTTSITGSGLTATNLIYVCQHKARLFFVENNTLNAWYLGTNAIAGAATKLDFSGLCSLGGELVAIGTWTRDGGSGADDLIVFLTDKGEALVYQGTDPASAETWSIIGVFKIGAPIGRRPFLSVGADLVVITEDGYVPLSKVLPVDRVGAEKLALSDNIRNAVGRAANSWRTNFGWEAVLYPSGNYALFNVPTSEGLNAEQYVMNTVTGAWCRFRIKAVCWAVFNNKLYFGAPGGFVVLADTTGYKDDSLAAVQAFANIQGDIRPAFQYFGKNSYLKRFTMVRPCLRSNASISLSLAMDVDFGTINPSVVTTPAVAGTPWGSPWGSPWGNSEVSRRAWVSVSGIGYAGSLHIRTATQGIGIKIDSIDYTYESGGVL